MTKTIGKYEIIRLVGSGATAEVYQARDIILDREVALKLLKPALVTDAGAFARFGQEARSAARLFHPNIATVLDMDEADGRYFITMRFIPGQSLHHILGESGPLNIDEVLDLADHIGRALDHAHKEGFLHRDVKPGNIIRSTGGDFVLTDFGLMRAMMATGLTSHTGVVLGTPAYIAPEIWLSEPAVPATDQYSLACVLYEALTGRVLFAGDTPPAIMTSHLIKGPDLAAAWPQSIPLAIQDVLARALARDPAARFPDLASFSQALHAAVRSPGPLPVPQELILSETQAPPPEPEPAVLPQELTPVEPQFPPSEPVPIVIKKEEEASPPEELEQIETTMELLEQTEGIEEDPVGAVAKPPKLEEDQLALSQPTSLPVEGDRGTDHVEKKPQLSWFLYVCGMLLLINGLFVIMGSDGFTLAIGTLVTLAGLITALIFGFHYIRTNSKL